MSDLDVARVLNGGPGPASTGYTFEGFWQGVIHHVDATGAYFTLPEWSDTHIFGPAYWHAGVTVDVAGGGGDAEFASHHHAFHAPEPGQVCAVLFAKPGVARPWVVAWSDA